MNAVKKLILIGNFPPDRQESMLRFENALAQGFAARGIALETWRPTPFFVKGVRHYRYGGLPKYLGYLDKFLRFPRELRRRSRAQPAGTVFHIIDHSNAVYAPALAAVPLLVTVHDLLPIRAARGEFPQSRPGRSGVKYQEWILRNLARLRAAACVSEKTRQDLQRLAGLSDASVAVVPNSLNYPYAPMPADDARSMLHHALARQLPPAEVTSFAPHLKADGFLFGIGGAQWYKNRTGLIAILAALREHHASPLPLLYAGPAFDPEQEMLIAQHGLRESIFRIQNLSNEELRAAYSLAAGLIFPSWEEGFGWPVAEAQACGCPVFTSNRAPMTEVGGDAAVYLDPADPRDAASRISAALANPAPLRAAGLARAVRWAPDAMLDAYQELYSLLVAHPHREPFSAR